MPMPSRSLDASTPPFPSLFEAKKFHFVTSIGHFLINGTFFVVHHHLLLLALALKFPISYPQIPLYIECAIKRFISSTK